MPSDSAESDFILRLGELFEEVDKSAYARHAAGAKEYGPFKFLENDTLEMLLEELYDIINYARYTAVKVKLLQEFLARQATDILPTDPQGGTFIPITEMGFKKS
jgi:hypothetical protein